MVVPSPAISFVLDATSWTRLNERLATGRDDAHDYDMSAEAAASAPVKNS